MKKRQRLSTIATWLLVGCLSALADDAKSTTLLFAGSSSTYWNDMPREVAKVVDRKVTGHVGAKVVPEIVGRSGSDIRVYLEPGFSKYEYGVKPGQSFLDRIRDEKPPSVVLQTVCRFIMGDDDSTGTGNAHAEAITKHCEAIRAAGGGWKRGHFHYEGKRPLADLWLTIAQQAV